MATTQKPTPAYHHPKYGTMADRSTRARHLMAGTEAMRENAQKYMPVFEGEDAKDYDARKLMTVLFDGYKQAVRGLTGILFAKPPELQADVAAELRVLGENIDGEGTHIAVFLRQVAEAAWIDGHSMIFVDMPSTEGAETLHEQRILGGRPYWHHVLLENLVSWRVGTFNGGRALTQIVMREVSEEPGDDDFSVVSVERYRQVYVSLELNERGEMVRRVRYKLWQELRGDTSVATWTVVEDGLISGDEIKLGVVFAGTPENLVESTPALLDLQFMNIAWLQKYSDIAYAEHKVCMPMPFLSGFTQDEAKELKFGPNRTLFGPKDSAATMLEVAGTGIAGVRLTLLDIEARMATMALSMIDSKSAVGVQMTATEAEIKQSAQQSQIVAVEQSLQDVAERCMGWSAEFLELDMSKGGSIKIQSGLRGKTLDPAVGQFLSNLAASNQITNRTMLLRLRALGWFDDDFDVDAETAKLNEFRTIPFRFTEDGAEGDEGDEKPGDTPPPDDEERKAA